MSYWVIGLLGYWVIGLYALRYALGILLPAV